MPSDRDEETGQYTEEFPLSAFLEAVRKLDVATTNTVADAVGCSYDLAYRRLKELEDAGELEVTKVGNAFLWSEPE